MPRIPSKSADGKATIAEQMIVEEVEMPARQPIDLGERVVHSLGVERPAAFEERVLVAEVAVLRTPAGDDDRVRNQIGGPSDQIAPDRRHAIQRAAGRGHVAAQRLPGPEVLEEPRERLLTRTQEDHICMRDGLVWKRGDVQAAQRDEDTLGAVGVGHRIRALRIGDVDLNDHQIRMVVGVHRADVFVNDPRLVVGTEIRGQRGQPEWGKQRGT